MLKLNSSSRLDDGQSSLLGLDYKLKSDTLGNYIKLSDLSVINAEKTNEQLDVITQSARLDNALKNIDLGIQSKYGEQMFKANLAKTIAEAFATNASVRQRDAQIAIDRQNANTNAKNAETNRINARTNAAVGSAQIRSLIAGAIKIAEETTGIKISNKYRNDLEQLSVDLLGNKVASSSSDASRGTQRNVIYNENSVRGGVLRFSDYLGDVFSGLNPFKNMFKK